MEARFVDAGLEALLDPAASAWRAPRAERVALIGTPAGLQPSAALRAAATGVKIGAVETVSVSTVHNGRALAFRLEWPDASEDRRVGDTDAFTDAAAVLLPSVAAAPIMTMGAPGQAVNAWYWRADDPLARHVVSEGLGTSRTLDTELVRGSGVWNEGRWSVVIARALRVKTSDPVAQLTPGETTGFGVAVWEGSHGERGGFKAFSGDWRELRLAAAPTARR